ncbi:MAG: HAMP domain-containing histidine kinase, partial [Deltaproteobacteria bacterium]|nr:HAMP domain-containing histidine kinase [Deltaproteobacteria bacterium]
GLSVAYDIVRKHGGDIRVRSGPGKGTTFIATIPLVKGD